MRESTTCANLILYVMSSGTGRTWVGGGSTSMGSNRLDGRALRLGLRRRLFRHGSYFCLKSPGGDASLALSDVTRV